MRAVRITEPGAPAVLRQEEVPEPERAPDEVLVEVRATAVNRADLLQRQGRYPAPPGAPEDIPGLEFAGEVLEVGPRVREVRPGDRVMGLLGGGGYAERVATPEELVLPVPRALSWTEAAAVPEVFFTAWDALFGRAAFSAGESVLVHAAGGGVGTAALQIAAEAGASTVFGTASSRKLEGLSAEGLPLDVPVDRHGEDFAEVVEIETAGRGVDVVLDTVGGGYWDRNVTCLAEGGRLVLIGLLGGRSAEVDLGSLLRKRLEVVGTVLRSRSRAEKATLTAEVRDRVVPLLEDGRLWPVLDRTFPLGQADEAHRYMAADRNLGKIVLEV